MGNKEDSLEFKVIKRIPLSTGVSSKTTSKNIDSLNIKRLDSIDIKETNIKETNLKKTTPDFKQNLKDIRDITFKKVSKLDDVENNLKEEVPFKIKKGSLELNNFKKEPNVLKNKSLEENKSLEKVSSFTLDDIKQNKIKPKEKKKTIKKIEVIDNLISHDASLKNQETSYPLHFSNEIYKEGRIINSLENILKNIDNPFTIKELSKKEEFIDQFNQEQNNVDTLLLELNKKTNKLDEDVFLESFSFLDNKPKIEKIKYPSYNVKHLYSKIDSLNKEIISENKEKINEKEKQVFKKDDFNNSLIEEIEIPDVYPLEDNVEDVNHIIENRYVKDSLEDLEDTKILNQDLNEIPKIKTNESSSKIPNFVLENKKIKLNKDIEENINRTQKPLNKNNNPSEKFNINKFSDKIKEDDDHTKDIYSKINVNKEDDQKIETKYKELKDPLNIRKQKKIKKEYIVIKEKPKVKKDLISEKYSDFKEKGIDYILPRDVGKEKIKKQQIYIESKPEKDSNFSSLVYTDPLYVSNKEVSQIFEKYSIDEFTYVTIYYDSEKGLLYNLVQPEIPLDEEKEYSQIKKIFFNTIDQNYYSFNGDKKSLEKYIEKIYDISLNKLSYSLNNLQKKLYFKFIQRDFFGLGILTNLLQDKKILEITCSGEKSSILVNHIEYGNLKTNISFSSIRELNNFVEILTKNMGLFITESHPVIDGYLPNGYKVEGLYSSGDTSSKGSSFVIKKYLDEPQSPVSLIKTSIGSIDLFTYIWSAISEDYKVIIVGLDDSFTIFNSILLFYPNKKIITVQSYDRLKLPQQEWINRVFTNNPDIDKKLIINQTISQKPDYFIVDQFQEDIFDVSWHNINMFSISPIVYNEVLEKLKQINQKTIVIELRNIKQEIKENIQIISIKEIISNHEILISEIDINKKVYSINLLSSNINIVDFLKRKKLLRWMFDSKIYNYIDFNNIVSEFYFQKDNIFKRLNIDIDEDK